MVRETSIETFHQIEAEGLLSKRRFETYSVLFKNGPLSATGIATLIPNFKSPSVGFNVHARLCELRDIGVVKECGTVECPHTGRRVILWDVTNKLPLKSDKPKKIICKHCHGKGYTIEQQFKLF